MPQKAIAIEHLLFRWREADGFALQIPEFSLARGQKILLAGPSGCGKSTLLNLIGGVLLPERGSIQVLGQETTTLSSLRRDQFRGDHIGFIFQLFNLVPYLSLVENVRLPCVFSKIRRDRARQRSGTVVEEAVRLLGELGMADKAMLRKPVVDLSVGQQQRVAVARALMGTPEVIIADEPTSALDPDLCGAFVDLLVRECGNQGCSLLFVSHDLSLAGYFDKVISLTQLQREDAQ